MGGFFRDNYDDKKIRVDDLKDASRQFSGIVKRMTGHGGDVRTAITQSAIEFSDLVASDIRDQGEYDEKKWRDASANCMVGSWITDLWVKNVETFRKELDEIQKEWDSFPPKPGPTATASDPNNPSSIPRHTSSSSSVGNWPGAPWVSYDTAKENKLRELIKRAEKAQEDFEEEAKKRKNNLEDGVTDDVIKQLADAGVVGWGAYNILGPTQPIPFPVNKESGKKYAEKLKKGIEDGTLADCDYEELTLILNALGKRSAEYQNSGKNLSKDEKAFIDAVLAELETLEPVPVPPGAEGEAYNIYRSSGVLSLPDHLKLLDVPEDDQKAILGAIGSGILTASDTRLGGGYEDVPASVKNAVEGSGRYDYPGKIDNWAHDTYRLSQLLEHAPEGLQGGTGFSAGLTTTIGVELEKSGDNIFHFRNQAGSEQFQNVIERSTLNKNANYLILTGQYESSSLTDDDTTKALKGLYSYDWKDDGKSVSGITEWIPESAQSKDEAERKLAADSSLGLIEQTTSVDSFQDITAAGSFIDKNSHIASSMGDVFSTYIYDFSRPGVSDFDFVTGEENDKTARNGEYMEIPMMNRVRFMQFIVGDDESAANMYADIHKQQMGLLDAHLNDGVDHMDVAAHNGTLRGLYDSAIQNDGWERFSSEKDIRDREVQIAKTGSQMFLDASVGNIPIAGSSISTGLKAYTDTLWDDNYPEYAPFEESVKDAEAERLDHSDSDSDDSDPFQDQKNINFQLQTQLQAIHDAVDKGEIDPQAAQDVLSDSSGKIATLPEDFRGGVRFNRTGAANSLLKDAGLDTTVNNYVRASNDQYINATGIYRSDSPGEYDKFIKGNSS
ncbi:hypothetical protein NOGI109294_00190 [Nocardiopsis gilva]|uniref:TPR repeat region-containing protein n=1 Tax=Nocardiopsis gilva TaxID=280236 RepID=UPI00034DD0A5|nr:hypothetical protein [Nocardiopsis gilva]